MGKRMTCLMTAATVLTIVLGTSCTKELKLPDIAGDSKIVLLGELITGDTVSLRAGEGLPLTAGSSMHFDLPGQLSMSLEQLQTGAVSPITVQQDAWSGTLNTLSATNSTKLKPGFSYRIQAHDDELGDASCDVNMPVPFQAQMLDSSTVNIAGTVALRTHIQFQDDGSTSNFYVIEAVKQSMSVDAYFDFEGTHYLVSAHHTLYDSLKQANVSLTLTYDTAYFNDQSRLVIYTDDPNSENTKLGTTFSPNKRMLLSDKSFNGGTYTTQLFIDKSTFIASDNNPKGRVLLWIKSVPEAYFNFLRTYESYESVTGWGSLSQPRKLDGNVQGGLGMVGSAARIEYVFLYDHWDF